MYPYVPLDYVLLKVKQSEENWLLFPLPNIPTNLYVHPNTLSYFLAEWVDRHWFIRASPSTRVLPLHLIYRLSSYRICLEIFSIIRNFEGIAPLSFCFQYCWEIQTFPTITSKTPYYIKF